MTLGQKKALTSSQREVRITNKLGLHARPAAQFVKRVRSFRSEIWVVKAGKRYSEFVKRVRSFRSEIWVVKAGKRYSASSLIDILRANLDCGATATLEAHGVDADDALDELEKLLAEFHEKETD